MLPSSILRPYYRLKYRPDPRSIDSDVEYALAMTRTYQDIAKRANIDLSRAAILEIGPGSSFAPQLVFASFGARVTVADLFLARWDPAYHPAFYRAFRAKWDGPTAAIDKVIDAARYPTGVIDCIEQSTEGLSKLRGQQFDVIISNAVLEHVSDLRSASRVLANLTKAGGINSHQVDFRDHLDRACPLEFLVRSDLQFWLERLRHPSQGNRIRHTECIAIFGDAGFGVSTTPNCFVDQTYFDGLLPRLRNSKSRYREWPLSDLRVLAARLDLSKNA